MSPHRSAAHELCDVCSTPVAPPLRLRRAQLRMAQRSAVTRLSCRCCCVPQATRQLHKRGAHEPLLQTDRAATKERRARDSYSSQRALSHPLPCHPRRRRCRSTAASTRRPLPCCHLHLHRQRGQAGDRSAGVTSPLIGSGASVSSYRCSASRPRSSPSVAGGATVCIRRRCEQSGSCSTTIELRISATHRSPSDNTC